MADDVAIMLENEARRIDRAIVQRNKALDGLDKERYRLIPMRYVLEFPIATFTASNDNASSPSIAPRSFIVRDQAQHFSCNGIVQSLIVVGTLDGGDAARFTLPPIVAAESFAYDFSIRDSYTDRAWCNVPIPGVVISRSYLQETLFARPARLPAGTQVEMSVTPFVASGIAAGLADVDIESYVLQVSFVGDEVIRVA